ncbi:hypothetical protein M3Y96_00879800 [Aphelenchoides besseyi]|nr:hypothetical protein M3Y96_00879800 [Aphelenchoides besseyi]
MNTMRSIHRTLLSVFWNCNISQTYLWLFLLVLRYNLPFALGSCPNGCACSEKSVVCSCTDEMWNEMTDRKSETVLRLSPFTGRLDFTNLLVIHSCDRLIVPNDTFVGVDIIDQLKILSIGQLEIESNAFRGLRTSLRQLVIQDSHIPLIPSHTFSGLAHLDHFWLKNVTIGRIAKMAFARLSYVRYFYFRDAAIQTVDAGAFAHMINITYFYMREKVLIKSMNDFAFVGSNIEELIFENAHVHASDLSLLGIQADRIHILNSKWNSRKVIAIRRIPSQFVAELLVQNSTLNRFVPALCYNYTTVRFEQCKIVHLQPAPTMIPQNITELSFSHCLVTHWHPHTLTSARNIGTIKWSYSSIENIHHHSIYASDLLRVQFKNVRITSLSSRAFERNEIQQVSLVESSFKLIGKLVFGSSNIQNFTIERVEVQILEAEALAAFNSSLFTITESRFGQFPTHLFHDSFIDDMSIRFCEFDSYPPRNAFHGLHANKLNVKSCRFNCSASACEENSLLLQSSIHSIAWTFEDNQCLVESNIRADRELSNICVQEMEITDTPGMACRRRLEIEECVCTDGTRDIVYSLSTNASILILGDCHRLKLMQSGSNISSIQILYLYRISSLEILSIDPSIMQLHILHSHVRFSQPYSFSNMNLHELHLVGTFVDSIAPLTFASSNIDFLYVNTSTLRSVAANSFFGSQIQTIEFWQANAISVGNMLENAREVRMESSFLHDVRGLENVTHLCLRNNSINCRCLIGSEAVSFISFRKLWAFTGPGFLMSIAYLDPGNIEGDLQSGAASRYELLWVLLVAHIFGLLLQRFSARVGVVCGYHMAEVLWVMVEIAIIASDMQEVIGTAIALYLLSNQAIPLWAGVLITIVDTFTFLFLDKYGVRKFELFFCFLISIMAGEIAKGSLMPWAFSYSRKEILSAVSVVGSVGFTSYKNSHSSSGYHASQSLSGEFRSDSKSTERFQHSSLVKSRKVERNWKPAIVEANKYFFIESAFALICSFFINLLVVSVFSVGFYGKTNLDIRQECFNNDNHMPSYYLNTFPNNTETADSDIYRGGVLLGCVFGSAALYIWAVGILAAGQSSTMTGTYAGQYTLEMVQLPFALLPVLTFAADKRLMKEFAMGSFQKVVFFFISVIVMGINYYFLYDYAIYCCRALGVDLIAPKSEGIGSWFPVLNTDRFDAPWQKELRNERAISNHQPEIDVYCL